MYIESVPNRNSPPAILLRESYRENGKVKKKTLANLTTWDPVIVAGLKALLKGGHVSNVPFEEQFLVERSLPHGHVAAVLGKFKQLKMPALLHRHASPERDLATALIVERLLYPGSKLSLSRHLSQHTATSTLGEELSLKEKVKESDLYHAMRWLLERQPKIEQRLAQEHLGEGSPILYDLSNSYYEGSTCVLAQRGYNRDSKEEDMVRAHMFICMLAYYLQWHLQQDLKPALFAEENPEEAQRKCPVTKADDELELHSLQTLLTDLSTLSRLSIRPAIKNASVFYKLTELTPVQEKAFRLLNITPKPMPCSQ